MSKLIDETLNPTVLLESLNDGVYAVDRDRRILYWNPAAERITGWRAEDILGKHCSDGVPCHVDKDGRGLCGKEHCPLHRAMVTDRGSDLPVIVFAQKNNGRRIPMHVSVAPIHNDTGEVIGGVETFRDASTEHQEAELTRRIQSTMLRRPVPQDRRVTFSTYYVPWSMVGGDYYAMKQVDKDRFAFILADVSGHGYAAAALVRMYQRESEGSQRRAQIRDLIQDQFQRLERYESVDGGWGYYDFSVGAKKPASSSTSFVNAAVLVSMDDARKIGIDPPQKLAERAVAATLRQLVGRFKTTNTTEQTVVETEADS